MSVMVPISAMPPPNRTVRQAVALACQRLRASACQWPNGTVTPPWEPGSTDAAAAQRGSATVEAVTIGAVPSSTGTVMATVCQSDILERVLGGCSCTFVDACDHCSAANMGFLTMPKTFFSFLFVQYVDSRITYKQHGFSQMPLLLKSHTCYLPQVACTLLQPLLPSSTAAVEPASGVLQLQGTITAVAVVPPRTSTAVAARCLVQDACRSLLARVELAAEYAAEGGDGKAVLFQGDKSARLHMAQRVAVTTGCPVRCGQALSMACMDGQKNTASTLVCMRVIGQKNTASTLVCMRVIDVVHVVRVQALPLVWDYVSHGEGRAAVAARVHELFGWEVDPGRRVAVLEAAGGGGALEPAWDPATHPKRKGDVRVMRSPSALTGLVRVVWALLAVSVLAALVVAWVHSVAGGVDVEEPAEALTLEETTETWE